MIKTIDILCRLEQSAKLIVGLLDCTGGSASYCPTSAPFSLSSNGEFSERKLGFLDSKPFYRKRLGR